MSNIKKVAEKPTADDIVIALRRGPRKKSISVRSDVQVRGADGQSRGLPYISIDEVETGLDAFFGPFGWKMEGFSYTIIGNEVMGQVTLYVRDPDTKEWVGRIGSAGALIQQRAGSNVMDASSKIANAVEKMAAHLLSDCLRNAAARFGRFFGRGLARTNVSNLMEDIWAKQAKDADATLRALPSTATVTEINSALALVDRDNPEYASIAAEAHSRMEAAKKALPAPTEKDLFPDGK